MSERHLLRPAAAADYDAVTALLRDAGLPIEGIREDLAGFLVAVDYRDDLVGVIGLERYGADALLRSAAVISAARGTGVGRQLVSALLEGAAADGIGRVYLLTTTAESYFARMGFETLPRSGVPDALRASAEFRGACPASATLMRRMLP